ncbi:MAG TPA: SLC13 family permease [Candidatus Izemoplasmatales bacterium]|nr:SLC13 family permease [Candidatus Izemoplasmatales bacterium]
MILALILFLATYVLLLVYSKYRAYIALGAALVFILFTYIPINSWLFGIPDIAYMPIEDIFKTIDWNVILMIFGTMGIVSLFIESKMPALMADKIIQKAPNVTWAIIALSVLSGLISAFVDNVATVLMVAPIALTICKKLKINPVPSLIAIAIASNLEGAATLVGDTTSVLLGSQANMDFFDFFIFQGKIGLFFIVQVGFLIATFVLKKLLGQTKEKPLLDSETVVKDFFPTYLMVGVIVLLILASFLPNKPNETNGYICVGLMLIGTLQKAIVSRDKKVFVSTFKAVDYFTLLLLAGLFIVIQSLNNAGVITAIGQLISTVASGNVFIAYTIIVWVSVLLSAFIDNIPYVLTMLPVAAMIATDLGVSPEVLYFGLLIGATLGGNMTPIGASANITAIGILRKDGFEVKTWDFMRLGIPYTLAAVTSGYLLTWLIWR